MNTAYGPQEYAKIEKKKEFWNYLSEEAQRAKNDGHGFILQGDWNARLGPEILPSDTKPANSNGKMLSEFVNSNRLIIMNTLDICKGSKTWSKTKDNRGEGAKKHNRLLCGMRTCASICYTDGY